MTAILAAIFLSMAANAWYLSRGLRKDTDWDGLLEEARRPEAKGR